MSDTSASTASQTNRLRVGDVHLQVRVDGTEGPWVILAHALGANLTLWDDTARHLAARYRVLRFDMRGHGGSDAPVGAYTMTRLADDVVALMDELDIAQAHFCGVSVGGMVAQTLGVRHPERLLSLTLVDTIHHTPLEARAMWANRIGRWKRMAWRDRRVDAEAVADRTVPRAAPRNRRANQENVAGNTSARLCWCGAGHRSLRSGPRDLPDSLPDAGGGRRQGRGLAGVDGRIHRP
jgi:pimeloyl-ACP methyl ester carboxylesterase